MANIGFGGSVLRKEAGRFLHAKSAGKVGIADVGIIDQLAPGAG